MLPMRRGQMLLLALTVAFAALCGCTGDVDLYNEESFEAAMEGVTDSDVLARTYELYLANATDTEVAVTVQDAWLKLDSAAAVAATKKLAQENPDSPHYVYLQGRLLETAREKVTAGRLAMTLDPKFGPGYRLVGGTYNQSLFRGRGTEDDALWLAGELEGDAAKIKEAVKVAPEEEWAWANLYGLQKHQENWQEALDTLLKGKEMGARFAADWYIASARMKLEQYDAALQEFVEGADKAVAAEEIEEAEKAEYIFVRYSALLGRNEHWNRLESYVRSLDGWETNPDYLVTLAGSQGSQGNMDAAFDHLKAAADHGFDSIMDLDEVTGIDGFTEDERYTAIHKKVQANWDAGAPERKAETLAGKISHPAYLWTLANAAGDSISLADLKDQIVILDFWATWCGPCRMAMPVLSNWMKTEMPSGVRVFSVNVWEDNPDGARKFITDNDYAMELVFGSNDLAAAYGVEGIPISVPSTVKATCATRKLDFPAPWAKSLLSGFRI